MQHAYIDEHSGIDSLIHRVDPRIKIIGFILIILSVVFTGTASFLPFVLYGAMVAALAVLSKIPARAIIKRLTVMIPFVLVISLFIPFMREDGVIIFANIMAKAILSALCMVILISSTRFPVFLKGLENLKCPRIITMILSFMYRYIFVLQDELMKMLQAKRSRSTGGSRQFHFRILANMVGVLFIRAYERGESVYLAMCSRGFSGNMNTAHDFRITAKDLVFITVIAVFLAGVKVTIG